MNLRKTPVIALSACALLFSCNKDTKIDEATAKKYIEDNYKLTEAPTAKSGKVSWDFKDCDEGLAKQSFDDTIKDLIKNTSREYSKTGNEEMNEKAINYYAETFYMSSGQYEGFMKLFDEITWYNNKTGLKAITIKNEDEGKATAKFQWDSTGRMASQNLITEGTVSSKKAYVEMTVTINY